MEKKNALIQNFFSFYVIIFCYKYQRHLPSIEKKLFGNIELGEINYKSSFTFYSSIPVRMLEK